MEDHEYFEQAVERVAHTTDLALTEREIVIALEKEIGQYRVKINALGDQNAEQAQAIENMKYRIAKLEEGNDKKLAELARIKNRNEQLETALNNRDEQIEELEKELEALQRSMMSSELIKALADNGYNTITINCYKDIEKERENGK